jgi:flavodoxin
MKTLVVYYSRTGRTKYVAELIAKELKADLEELVDDKERVGGWGFFTSILDALFGRQTNIEQLGISTKSYDLIIIGQPVWAGKPVPAVRTFAKRYKLIGKDVAFFVTLDKSGADACLKETRKLFLASKILMTRPFIKPLDNKEKTEKEVRRFVEKLLM